MGVFTGPRDSSELAPSALSVRDLYQRVERAITRPGRVYHQTESITGEDFHYGNQIVESWVDPARDSPPTDPSPRCRRVDRGRPAALDNQNRFGRRGRGAVVLRHVRGGRDPELPDEYGVVPRVAARQHRLRSTDGTQWY